MSITAQQLAARYAHGRPVEVINSVQRMVNYARTLPPDQLIPVEISLRDQPFNWVEFRNRGLTDDDRAYIASLRTEQSRGAASPIVARLVALGVTQSATGPMVPSVFAGIPARLIPEVADWPEVTELVLSNIHITPSYASGNEGRVDARTYAADVAGINGQVSGRFGGKVRIGILEFSSLSNYNMINMNYEGFRDYDFPSTFVSRVKKRYECADSGCTDVTTTWVPPSGITLTPGNALMSNFWKHGHGTAVAQIAAGYIPPGTRDGFQVSNWSLNGIATKAHIYYYQFQEASQEWLIAPRLQAAILKGLADGVDVMNMSFGQVQNCSYGYNPVAATPTDSSNTIAQTFILALNSGMLLVSGAGNTAYSEVPPTADNGFDGIVCNTDWPSTRHEVLAVGGLTTPSGTVTWANARVERGSNVLPLRAGSSTGGMNLIYGGSVKYHAAAVVGVATAFNIDVFYPPAAGQPSGDYKGAWYFDWVGTSFSAPMVTGAAALMTQVLGTQGKPRSGWDLLVTMLNQGDNYADIPNINSTIGFDRRSGSGRLRMHFPLQSIGSVTTPTGWGSHDFTMPFNGMNVRDLPIGDPATHPLQNVNYWRGVMTWDHLLYSNMSDFYLEVVSKCPGQSEFIIDGDWSFDLYKRIHLTGAQINNTCPYMRVTAYNIPYGGSRRVHMQDYFQGGAL